MPEANTSTTQGANGGDLKALCMKCRDENKKPTMQTMTSIVVEEKEGKGGSLRYSAKGKCSNCGGNMFKFLSKDDAERLRATA